VGVAAAAPGASVIAVNKVAVKIVDFFFISNICTSLESKQLIPPWNVLAFRERVSYVTKFLPSNV